MGVLWFLDRNGILAFQAMLSQSHLGSNIYTDIACQLLTIYDGTNTKQLEKSAVTYSWAQELYITDQISLGSNTKLSRS